MNEVAPGILNITLRTVADPKYGRVEQRGLESSAELIPYAFTQGLVPGSNVVEPGNRTVIAQEPAWNLPVLVSDGLPTHESLSAATHAEVHARVLIRQDPYFPVSSPEEKAMSTT